MIKKRITRALLYLQRIKSPDEKPDPVSSLRIAWYLQSRLDFDVVWDTYNPGTELPERIDELWFVASSWAFLDDAFRQQSLKIFPLAKRVIWCNNDRNVPWHAYHLGRCQPRARLHALTTVAELSERFGMHAPFNWNRLTFQPVIPETPHKERLSRLYYYGSLRPDRLKTFDRYFPAWGNRLTMAAANGKDRKKFADRYPTIEVLERAPNVFTALDRYAATPILEDVYSRTHYVSPPNRFYEALSAGTAMYFEPESVDMWRAYGYDVSRFVIPENINDAIDNAGRVARSQRKWERTYLRELDADFDDALSRIRKDDVGITGPPPGAKRYL